MKESNRYASNTSFFMAMIFGLCSIASTAQAECKFTKAEGADGVLLYGVSSPYDSSTDERDVLNRYLSAAGAEGYLIASQPDFSKTSPSFLIGKPSSNTPTVIELDRAKAIVSLITIIPPGNQVDPDEKARLCKLSALARGESVKQIEERSRTAMPDTTPTRKMLSPTTAFELSTAKKALEPGGSTIRGQACAHDDRGLTYAAGSTVYLYPATPYIEQLFDLIKKAKSEDDVVIPDEGLSEARMQATADGSGKFQFSKMKPGRYIISTSVSGIVGGRVDVYAGSVSNGYASANVYRSEDRSRGAESSLTKEVQIKNDGDTVKVTMQPSIKPLQFKQGLRGAIQGCRW